MPTGHNKYKISDLGYLTRKAKRKVPGLLLNARRQIHSRRRLSSYAVFLQQRHFGQETQD